MLYVAERRSELHRKTKGDVTEAYLTARFLELGYTVLKPVGDNARYDLVIERGGCFHRVQCKTATWGDEQHGTLVFAACSTNWHLRNGKRGYHGDADLFGVYFPALRKAYLIPVAECGHTEIRLRITPTRNCQVRGIRFATDYEI